MILKFVFKYIYNSTVHFSMNPLTTLHALANFQRECNFFVSSVNSLGSVFVSRAKVERHIWVELKSTIKNLGQAKV